MIYELYLINRKDRSLDLRLKENEIKEVIDYVLRGGSKGTAYGYVGDISLESVRKDIIVLHVEESYNKWHWVVGQRLAQQYGMRNYCDPNNPERMFKWVKV